MNALRHSFESTGPTPEKRRVLFVINSLAGGGAERVMATLLANSEAWVARYQIALVVLDEAPQAYKDLVDGFGRKGLKPGEYLWASEIPARVIDE